MDSLLLALGLNIKSTGSHQWIAKCPVHQDSDFAMSIEKNAKGVVLAHCHSCGCNGLDLYKHLGLPLKELFGGIATHRGHVPDRLKDDYDTDKLCIEIFSALQAKGVTPNYDDKKRYRKAVARVSIIESKYLNKGDK